MRDRWSHPGRALGSAPLGSGPYGKLRQRRLWGPPPRLEVHFQGKNMSSRKFSLDVASVTKLPVSKSPQIATYASEKKNKVSVQLLVILKGQEQLPKSLEVGNPCVSFLRETICN